MTETKIPKILILIAILALAGALAIAGCGGSGGTTTEGTGAAEEPNATKEAEEAPAEEEPAEEAEEEPAEEAEEEPAEEEPAEAETEAAGGEEAALSAEGKTVFTANCGSCHTLQAAGTSGTVGPDLDELKLDLGTIEHQVVNGGGAMPAFGKDGTLNPKEIKAVSTYVAAVAGQG